MAKYGFLGPKGTFSEEAILKALQIKENNLQSFPSSAEVIKAVDKGKIKKGIVPIENSTEGSVNVTLDMIVSASKVLIEKEIISNIHQNLIVSNNLKLKDIKKIYSHPQAAAQCRNYLQKKLTRVPVIASSSTAEAVKIASVDEASAAIGTKLAAKLYKMKLLDTNIEDFKENQTRFVLIGKDKTKKTGKDKTTIACFIKKNRPGSLLEILTEFANRKINLTKIQSRPTKKVLGDYYFWIDIEGHLDDKSVKEALAILKKKLRSIRTLGSYPRG